jgi:hypothetical protein
LVRPFSAATRLLAAGLFAARFAAGGTIYREESSASGVDLMLAPIAPPVGDEPSSTPATPTTLLKTAFNEYGARLSPTDQWMAYTSDESGRDEVYVRPYPNVQAGRRFQVSTGGGTGPRWSRDGRELFYVSPDDELMVVRVEPGSGWRTSPPVRLFPMGSYVSPEFDVSADGQRFLMIKEAAGGASATRNLVVIQNCSEELKRLSPTK